MGLSSAFVVMPPVVDIALNGQVIVFCRTVTTPKRHLFGGAAVGGLGFHLIISGPAFDGAH